MAISRRSKTLAPVRSPRGQQEYAGMWIATVKGKVVAAGRDSRELETQMRRLGSKADNAVVRKVSRPRDTVSVGLG